MTTMKMIWGVCLLCLAGGLRGVQAGPLRRTSKTQDQSATREEVNVLMFGVIQFSDSVNYMFETTEGKIAEISETLKSHEATLQRLGKKTEQAADTKKQIKEIIQLLQAQTVKQQAQAKTTKDWLTSVEKEEVELKTKVKRLEMYLNNSAPTSIKDLQERAEDLSNFLKDLQHLTEFQKENIKSQDEQLSRLQKMSEAMR